VLHEVGKGFIAAVIDHIHKFAFIAGELEVTRGLVVEVGIGDDCQMEALATDEWHLQ
jgi:hypothetical protein